MFFTKIAQFIRLSQGGPAQQCHILDIRTLTICSSPYKHMLISIVELYGSPAQIVSFENAVFQEKVMLGITNGDVWPEALVQHFKRKSE